MTKPEFVDSAEFTAKLETEISNFGPMLESAATYTSFQEVCGPPIIAPIEIKLSAAEVAPFARTVFTGIVHVFVIGLLGVRVKDSKPLLFELSNQARMTL